MEGRAALGAAEGERHATRTASDALRSGSGGDEGAGHPLGVQHIEDAALSRSGWRGKHATATRESHALRSHTDRVDAPDGAERTRSARGRRAGLAPCQDSNIDPFQRIATQMKRAQQQKKAAGESRPRRDRKTRRGCCRSGEQHRVAERKELRIIMIAHALQGIFDKRVRCVWRNFFGEGGGQGLLISSCHRSRFLLET